MPVHTVGAPEVLLVARKHIAGRRARDGLEVVHNDAHCHFELFHSSTTLRWQTLALLLHECAIHMCCAIDMEKKHPPITIGSGSGAMSLSLR